MPLCSLQLDNAYFETCCHALRLQLRVFVFVVVVFLGGLVEAVLYPLLSFMINCNFSLRVLSFVLAFCELVIV